MERYDDSFSQLEKEMEPIYILKKRIKGKKFITTIEGLTCDNIDRIYKYLCKRICYCGGSFNKNTNVITLQGNHIEKVKDFILSEKNIHENKIIFTNYI